MNTTALLLALTFILSSSNAEPCDATATAVTRLREYFAYEHGLGPAPDESRRERFTGITIGNRAFFRLDTPPADYQSGFLPAYTYQPSKRIDVTNCPSDSWAQCIAEYLETEDHVEISRSSVSVLTTGSCELTLDVPKWRPSPNDDRKKRLAAEILQEIVARSDENPRSVYVRDFNDEDPDILIRVVTQHGDDRFLGCTFDSAASQHCSWHMFGQTPLRALRRLIMERPYQLFPSKTKE